MKYKWIVADCDDTLLKGNLEISPRTKNAIREYMAAGGRFSIATGRMPMAVLPYCRELGLKGEAVCYQGAVVADIETGKVLESTPVPQETALEVGKYLEERNLYYHLYRDDKIITHKRSLYSLIYAYYCRCKRERQSEPLTEVIAKNGWSPIKMLVMESPKKIYADMKKLQERFSDKLLINTSKSFLIELVNKEISKGVALKRLGERYGILPEETIAVGDSGNDISMIEYAGFGVAMGNASEDLKAAADYIAPDNEHDGVGYIIEKFGLEREPKGE